MQYITEFATDTYNTNTYGGGSYSTGSASATVTTPTASTNTSSGSASSAPKGGTLSNTGIDIFAAATMACLIIFISLIIRFWKRKPKSTQ
jgi:hypothetical protein